MDFIGPLESQFLIALLLSSVIGILMGLEREERGKDAGVSTHIFVILGAALFTIMSSMVDPNSTSRIASQVVIGIGFLGAGLILREGEQIRNLTTAASLWYSAAVGMAIGFGFYAIAIIAGIAGLIIPRIPSLRKQ